MRWMLFAVVLLAVSCAGTQHSEVNPKTSWMGDLEPTNVSLTSNFRSQYVISTGLVLYDQPVIQSDVFVKTKCGLSLDLWASVPTHFDELGDNYGTEIDLTLGWAGRVSDYNLSFGVGYWDLHRTGSLEGTDFVVPYGEVSRDFKIGSELTFSPYLKSLVNFTPNGVLHGDALPEIGVRSAWNVNDAFTLTGKVLLLYDPGVFGFDVAWIGSAESSLQVKLGDHAVVELPYAKVIGPFNDVNDGRETEFVVGMGLTLRF